MFARYASLLSILVLLSCGDSGPAGTAGGTASDPEAATRLSQLAEKYTGRTFGEVPPLVVVPPDEFERIARASRGIGVEALERRAALLEAMGFARGEDPVAATAPLLGDDIAVYDIAGKRVVMREGYEPEMPADTPAVLRQGAIDASIAAAYTNALQAMTVPMAKLLELPNLTNELRTIIVPILDAEAREVVTQVGVDAHLANDPSLESAGPIDKVRARIAAKLSEAMRQGRKGFAVPPLETVAGQILEGLKQRRGAMWREAKPSKEALAGARVLDASSGGRLCVRFVSPAELLPGWELVVEESLHSVSPKLFGMTLVGRAGRFAAYRKGDRLAAVVYVQGLRNPLVEGSPLREGDASWRRVALGGDPEFDGGGVLMVRGLEDAEIGPLALRVVGSIDCERCGSIPQLLAFYEREPRSRAMPPMPKVVSDRSEEAVIELSRLLEIILRQPDKAEALVEQHWELLTTAIQRSRSEHATLATLHALMALPTDACWHKLLDWIASQLTVRCSLISGGVSVGSAKPGRPQRLLPMRSLRSQTHADWQAALSLREERTPRFRGEELSRALQTRLGNALAEVMLEELRQAVANQQLRAHLDKALPAIRAAKPPLSEAQWKEFDAILAQRK